MRALIHRFIDFIQVAFWADKMVENKFALPGDHLKKRFLDFNLVVFCAGQEADNEFKKTCEPM